jgi:hypothetical protein
MRAALQLVWIPEQFPDESVRPAPPQQLGYRQPVQVGKFFGRRHDVLGRSADRSSRDNHRGVLIRQALTDRPA